MAEDKKTPIVLDGIEYFFEDMTDAQKLMVNHIADLDRKIASSQFNLDQLLVGKDAFIQRLKTELNTVKEPEAEVTEAQ